MPEADANSARTLSILLPAIPFSLAFPSRAGARKGGHMSVPIPRSAWVIALSAATLGIIYGYDGSNIAGAQLYFADYFGLDGNSAAVETPRPLAV